MDGDRKLERIQAHLDRACTLLTAASPAGLDGSEEELTAAVAELGSPPPLAPQAMRELRRSIAKAGRLLEAVSAYHRDWTQRLGSLLNGYTSNGQPATIGHAARWSLEG
jgi:hypothetical protein